MKNILWFLFAIILFQGCASSPTPPPISERTNEELIQELKTYEYASNKDSEYPLQEVLDELSKRGASASEVAPMLAKMIAFDGAASVTASKPLVAMGSSAKSAIPYLLENLSSSREDVRRYSIFVLGIIGPSASCSVPKIAVFLWDTDAYVRSATAGALTEITQIELVEDDFCKLDPKGIGSVCADEPEGHITNIARDWWQSIGQNQNWITVNCEFPE